MESHHDIHNNQHQSESAKRFKTVFQKRMKQLLERVESRANESGFSGNWRDAVAGAGIGVTALAGGTVATILGTAGMLTAAATAGASLAVAVAGIAAAEGYNIYRNKQKKIEYTRAMNLLQRDDFEGQLAIVAEKLSSIYRYQLQNCSPSDAEVLADACFKALKHEIMTNKNIEFRDLIFPSHLQALILRSAKHVAKVPVDINAVGNDKSNSRGAISHAGLYCEGTKQFYRCEASKPAKYGVLFFKDKHDLEDYQMQVKVIKGEDDRWKFKKMSGAEVSKLIRNQLFHHEDEQMYQTRDDDSDEQQQDSSHCLTI